MLNPVVPTGMYKNENNPQLKASPSHQTKLEITPASLLKGNGYVSKETLDVTFRADPGVVYITNMLTKILSRKPSRKMTKRRRS